MLIRGLRAIVILNMKCSLAHMNRHSRNWKCVSDAIRKECGRLSLHRWRVKRVARHQACHQLPAGESSSGMMAKLAGSVILLRYVSAHHYFWRCRQ